MTEDQTASRGLKASTAHAEVNAIPFRLRSTLASLRLMMLQGAGRGEDPRAGTPMGTDLWETVDHRSLG